ncbi:MOSC domain-containing protein [Lentiprolixibacter aurantiacus]|uniref:MOSC domain-containing protein n=1 Tax=Lentiprolixibacter aurantiacus TaxID=2993939 RepID=A0AAE3MLU9_9FLAO|nr:MOSC domain-containing protein [Lentiprolixibacter aurantiacus]MCX2720170.1 MOSC domain-containing protein [Lentiprolixibacter aurantiacus]
MKVVSTNIARPREISWKGKTEFTGIYKEPVNDPIFLGKEEVHGDTIVHAKVHGGIDKACYLFSTDEYNYWKNKYPDLDWNWGMFGENLSISGLDESKLRIGDVLQIGKALVEVSEPREPCYKLGIKFGNQGIIQEFVDRGFPGTYVRILEEGLVSSGDRVTTTRQSENTLTVKAFFELRYMQEKDPAILQLALENPALSSRKKAKLKKFL